MGSEKKKKKFKKKKKKKATVELVKSLFRYLFKPFNYVLGRLVCQIRAGDGCVRMRGTV